MPRKVILSLAISLDGFLADPDGGYAWIRGDGSHALDNGAKWDYPKFLAGVDLVVMGRHCYDQGMYADFKDQQVLVATSRPLADAGNVRFVADPVAAVREAMCQPGKDIFLFGRGILIESFLAADLVDEFILGIMPVMLGGGRPAFLGKHAPIPLKLYAFSMEEGIALLRYSRRGQEDTP
jgi:dihydrofolate reductase